MKPVLYLFALLFLCKIDADAQIGMAAGIATEAFSKLFDNVAPDMVYDPTTHSAIVALKAEYVEQIAQTIKLVKESYEISRTLKNSDSFLQGMSTIIQQNKELVNNAGWVSQSIGGLTVQAAMTEEITKALQAQRRIMDAQLKDGDYEGALYSAEQYYYNFEKFISSAKRNFEWALKEGENVNLTQADRLKYLETCDKNFEGAVKQRQFMEALAKSMEANAASKTKEDYTTKTKDTYTDKDPEMPVFEPKNEVE